MKKKFSLISIIGKTTALRLKNFCFINATEIIKLRIIANTGSLEQVNDSVLKMKQIESIEIHDNLNELTPELVEGYPLKTHIEYSKPHHYIRTLTPSLLTNFHFLSMTNEMEINYIKPSLNDLMLFGANVVLIGMENYFLFHDQFLKYFRLVFGGLSSYSIRRRLVFRPHSPYGFRYQKHIYFSRRSMLLALKPYKSFITRVVPSVVSTTPKRSHCNHAGRFIRKKIVLQDTDDKVHDVVVTTSCPLPDCETTNCADPQSSTQCRTVAQNQQSIPPTSQGYTTKVIGNLTHTIPANKSGGVVNANHDYNNLPKTQRFVEEKVPPTIDSADFQVNPKSTAFVQEPSNHKAIDKIIK